MEEPRTVPEFAGAIAKHFKFPDVGRTGDQLGAGVTTANTCSVKKLDLDYLDEE